jgi:sortase (surface protein transpeptidase)
VTSATYHRRSKGRQGNGARVRGYVAAALIAASVILARLAYTSTDGTPDESGAAEAIPAASVAVAPPPGPTATPVRIVIPSIGVNAGLEALHRGGDGTLKPPNGWDNAGWYADGVVPGQRGPAVILGHVDSARYGPAVFFQLGRLQSGDVVMVDTSDGRTEYFIVDTVRQFPKADFPTKLVYGPTALPELRLITCTGSFDHSKRSYLDNLVVTAYSDSIARR